MDVKQGRCDINRRHFLKASAVGAAAAVTGLRAGAAEAPKLDFRTLGRTGMKITTVSIGAMRTSEAAVFQAAFDMGLNYIDTARVYMNGKNEAIVGEALQGYRDKVFVATKAKPGSTRKMVNQVSQSLSLLKTDYVDLLQLHSISSKNAIMDEEIRTVMAEAKKKGQTRFIGVTTHKNEEEVIQAVLDDPDKLYDTILVKYNFQSPGSLKALIAKAAAAGIGIIAMKTQAGGYTTKELGDISPHQAALKWVLQDTNVTAAIPAMVDLAQLEEDTAVMGMPMTPVDVATLNRYQKACAPYYCHMCGACETTCANGVDIPNVNRSLMYAEGYGDIALARSAYGEIAPAATPAACGDCTQCTARCVRGLDIAAKMQRAGRLFA
ncbi:MAG: twin-arginine translocation signal domain-containing protein [Nitrospiraceae bacterium]|nr:twin-arginine translocation signal domain-containing protein [Nitrospiraceae bacterium]